MPSLCVSTNARRVNCRTGRETLNATQISEHYIAGPQRTGRVPRGQIQRQPTKDHIMNLNKTDIAVAVY